MLLHEKFYSQEDFGALVNAAIAAVLPSVIEEELKRMNLDVSLCSRYRIEVINYRMLRYRVEDYLVNNCGFSKPQLISFEKDGNDVCAVVEAK